MLDALGTVRGLVSPNGSITNTYLYDAWGNQLVATGAVAYNFRWVGELGYYWDIDRAAPNMRARAYSPSTARFLSADPLGFVDGASLYRYAGNRPLLMVDPAGLESANGAPLPGTVPGRFNALMRNCFGAQRELHKGCCCTDIEVKYKPSNADRMKFGDWRAKRTRLGG